jgi:hypothetical protein
VYRLAGVAAPNQAATRPARRRERLSRHPPLLRVRSLHEWDRRSAAAVGVLVEDGKVTLARMERALEFWREKLR